MRDGRVRPALAVATVAMAAAIVMAAASASAQVAGDAPDRAMYRRIRDEGTARSKVMGYASELMDGIGARLTGSPALEAAIAWAMNRLEAAGAASVRKESWGEFGMAWRQRNVWVRLVRPYPANFVAVAAPFSPATPGPIQADVVAISIRDDKGFDEHRGKLRGKIVMLRRSAGIPESLPVDKPLFERLDAAALAELARDAPPRGEQEDRATEQAFEAQAFAERIGRFLADEGVRAVMEPSGNNAHGGSSGGTLFADWNYNFGAYAHQPARAMRVPLVIVAVEEYLRIERLQERNVPVTVEMNVDVERLSDRAEGFNVLADIPGVDARRRDDVVMITAHLDSWAVGTGATDDGAGVVVAMEALRILKALGVRPARTIRIALWTGHEQGAIGSLSYVTRAIADLPRAATPAQLLVPEGLRRVAGPIVPKAGHARLSAVYNLDTGAGKIRAIAVDGNAALVPIFEQWLAPLKDLGVDLVTMRPWCPGDCLPFRQAGIPTPGFIQDPLDYGTRTHHTTSDTYDRLVAEDLRQAAIVIATLLYNTAMRDEQLPRSR